MTDFWEQLEQAPGSEPQFLTTDPEGRSVYLSRQQWEEHILPNHRHLAPYRDLLVSAVANPLFREWEEPDERGRFSVRYHADLPPDDHFPSPMLVRVVVKYLYRPFEPRSLVGLISTAYLMHQPSR